MILLPPHKTRKKDLIQRPRHPGFEFVLHPCFILGHHRSDSRRTSCAPTALSQVGIVHLSHRKRVSAAELSDVQVPFSKIRLLSLDFEATGAISAFPNLIELQLNGTLLTWSEAHGIIAQMPQLRSLEMGYNELTSLSGPPNGSHMHHSHLQILNFDNNKLSDWAHVASSTSSLSRYF